MPRPANPNPPTRQVVALEPELWAQVIEYWHGSRLASKSEAVRRLIQAGLRAETNNRLEK